MVVLCLSSGTVLLRYSLEQIPEMASSLLQRKVSSIRTPRSTRTKEDIDNDTSGDLNKKLQLALTHLPALGIKGVIQGDFLFDQSELKTKTIDGQKYVTFHPNTIVYAVYLKPKLELSRKQRWASYGTPRTLATPLSL